MYNCLLFLLGSYLFFFYYVTDKVCECDTPNALFPIDSMILLSLVILEMRMLCYSRNNHPRLYIKYLKKGVFLECKFYAKLTCSELQGTPFTSYFMWILSMID